MRVYLDNCTFNRPFDDQTQIRIRLETEAKLYIQERIRDGTLELVWSYILDYENLANPFEERRNIIQNWKASAFIDVDAGIEILAKANTLREIGLRNKDALHLACAIAAKCDYFVTTDDVILKKTVGFEDITVIDPPSFIRSVFHDNR
jgi:predicted nucleic acid-binding protein